MRLHRLFVLFLATGCYGAAPPKPTTIPLPPLVAGAQLDVASETTTKLENVPKKSVTCPAGHIEGSPQCSTTRWSELEPVTRTHSTMTYNGEPIDEAQFNVLTDPEHDHKVAELDRLTRRCNNARIHSWVGMGLLTGGALTWAEGAAQESKTVANIGLLVIAAGFGAYAYGYWGAGGNHCDDAEMLYRKLEYGRLIGNKTVTDRAFELKQLADKFNTTMHAQAKAP